MRMAASPDPPPKMNLLVFVLLLFEVRFPVIFVTIEALLILSVSSKLPLQSNQYSMLRIAGILVESLKPAYTLIINGFL